MAVHFVYSYMDLSNRTPLLIGVYSGLQLISANLRQAVTEPSVQAEAVLALHERLHTPALLTAMDLSVEAEAFGCRVHMVDDEIPTVIGRLVTTESEISALAVPQPGDSRSRVYLDTVRSLVKDGAGTPVFAGLIGPFTLAGRIFGMSETLELSISNPELLESLLEKVTTFLAVYVRAFRDVGAAGVIMAEPAAGLISPRGLARFSTPYVRHILQASRSDRFTFILHNCGARLPHLQKVLEAGADIYHFGAPMDMPAAFRQITEEVTLSGNLDPATVFRSGTPESIFEATTALLKSIGPRRNFIPASGCDLPPGTPILNLEAFCRAVEEFEG